MLKKLMLRKVGTIILFMLLVVILPVTNYYVVNLEPEWVPPPHISSMIWVMKWILQISLSVFSFLVGFVVISKIEITNQKIREQERKIKEWEEQDQDSV